MRDENLTGIDLNLLVALRALLELRSVSKAAQDLGLSQPAMSHALGRIREALGDPILVRSGRYMVPTPRAERLLPRVRKVLQDVEQLLVGDDLFTAETAVRVFTMTTNGFASFSMLPALRAVVSEQAPGVDLRIRQLARENLREMLADGDVDMALFTGAMHELPESLYSRKLYDDPFVCLVRREHPRVQRGRLALKDFVEMEHILVSPRGDAWGVVDHALADMGRARRVSLVVPNFVSVPQLIETSDLVVTIPVSMARVYARSCEVDHVEPPLALPVGALYALWHERVHEDAANRWLRDAVWASVERSASIRGEG